MSSEPVEAVGRLSASRDWRQNDPESDGALRTAAVKVAPAPFQPDGAQLSPLAQLVGTLEALKESDPDRYGQVTWEIAKNLLSAARMAGSRGDSGAASELYQLATDFSAASGSGQLQTLLEDLSQTVAASHAGSASGIRGDGSTHTKLLAVFRANESHSAQRAALDEAAVFVSTVSTVVLDVETLDHG